jgi:hypothetical protein
METPLVPTVVVGLTSVTQESFPLTTEYGKEDVEAATQLLNTLGLAGSIVLMSNLVTAAIDSLHRLLDEDTRGESPDEEKLRQFSLIESVAVGFDQHKNNILSCLLMAPDISLCTPTTDSPDS